MLLLTDQSMEIPAFLLRNSDGSFKHPDVAFVVPEITAAVKIDALPNPYPRELTDHDKRVIAMIEREQIIVLKETQTVKNTERKAAKQAEKERLHINKMAARKEFVKHFKWDWEQ